MKKETKEKLAFVITGLVLTVATAGICMHIVREGDREIEEMEARYMQQEESMKANIASTIAEQLAYEYHVNNVLKNDCVILREEPIYRLSDEYLDWQAEMDPIYGETSDTDYSDFLITEGNVSEMDKEYCKQYLDYINPKTIELMSQQGWKIILTDANLATECGYEEGSGVTTFGVTYRNQKIVKIQADEQSIGKATLHEIGHAVCETWLEDTFEKNGYTNWDSKDFATVALHTENRRYIYEIKDELMAQLFVEYCMYPEELKAQSKSIYQIYDNLVQIAMRQQV